MIHLCELHGLESSGLRKLGIVLRASLISMGIGNLVEIRYYLRKVVSSESV